MNPVQLVDLEARWRPLTSAEQVTGLALLDDAWALVTTRIPGLPDDLTSEVVSKGVVTSVLTAMVLRVMRNPDGKVQESIDDYSYRRAEGVASGALYLTDDERALLSPNQGVGGAFSITPYGQSDLSPEPWYLRWI